MRTISIEDFSEFLPVYYLWPDLVDKIGLERSKRAVQQALDLQRMYGDEKTIPVLIYGTCGIALTSIEKIHSQLGIPFAQPENVLLINLKGKIVQILAETCLQ